MDPERIGSSEKRTHGAAEPSRQNDAHARYVQAEARLKYVHHEIEAMLQDLRDIAERDLISESGPSTVESTGIGQLEPLETSYQRVDSEDSPPQPQLFVAPLVRMARWQHAILAICATLILFMALSALLFAMAHG